jgi:hypothetical protein
MNKGGKDWIKSEEIDKGFVRFWKAKKVGLKLGDGLLLLFPSHSLQTQQGHPESIKTSKVTFQY